MDNSGLYFKALLASLITAITLRFGAVGDLLWLFFAAITLDYLTGIAAAIYNKELNSSAGFRGIIKKVSELFVIAVAILCDEVVSQASEQLGMPISTGFAIAAIVTIWLILTELISILENVARMNIALPPFLLSAIKFLKKKTETAGADKTPDDSKF